MVLVIAIPPGFPYTWLTGRRDGYGKTEKLMCHDPGGAAREGEAGAGGPCAEPGAVCGDGTGGTF